MPVSKGRVRDKWRLKTWCTVYAPSYFGGHNVATIPVTDPEKTIGRVVETTLYDLIKQDIFHTSIKMYFQIVKIQEGRADTIFKSHEYAREYLRSLVRRGSTRVDEICNVQTKDGYKVRTYAVIFSRRRLTPSQQTDLRNEMRKVLIEKSKTLTYDQLAQELVLGKIASDIYNLANAVSPIRHAGIRKSKLLAQPQATVTATETASP